MFTYLIAQYLAEYDQNNKKTITKNDQNDFRIDSDNDGDDYDNNIN